MLSAILGSKLYQDSIRKDKIATAFSDPVNKELVVQLSKYLDEDVDENPSAVDFDFDEDSLDSEGTSDSTSKDEGSGSGAKFSSTGSKLSSKNSSSSDLGDSGDSDISGDEVKDMEFDSTPDDSDDSDVEESAKVRRRSIIGSLERIHPVISISDQTDSIQGLLNANESTSGVVRCVVKDSELWVYYNDKINLNNVMEPVIHALIASDYGHLEFNRLARTDNAMVFMITDSLIPVDSEVVEDE